MNNVNDDSILPVGTKVVLLPTSQWADVWGDHNPVGIVGTVESENSAWFHGVDWSNGKRNDGYKHGPDIVPLRVYLVMRFKSFLESKGAWEGWNRLYDAMQGDRPKAEFLEANPSRNWISGAFVWPNGTWRPLSREWRGIVEEVGE